MAPRSSKSLKTKEVKIPHLMVANRKKMVTWGLGGLFAADWTKIYEELMEELAGQQKEAIPKYEYHGKPEEWMLEHFQLNLLVFYYYAWVAINDPSAPTPDWGDAVEKTVSRQIKALRVCNEATCLGPYLAHLYSHFHEMDVEEKEESKK
ncbi:hypothetical protein R1flu_024494 [Riccia fluitans]|uniref:Uncharacterized protein n=1 Tax=Riccia fluitans TaxID=41844 RepID=A0ABD1XV15_9MARC